MKPSLPCWHGQQGAEVICFAPDKNQADVINHLTGEPMAETRNVLIEAARIARVTSILWQAMPLSWMR
jgi:enhancing lycopene biosynthesis protein 2